MEFGNVLRAMVGYHQLFSWFTWVTALVPIFGWIIQMGANVSLYWFFTSGQDYYYAAPKLEEFYDCLQRSEVEGFSADNYETEFWFQKKYIEESLTKIRDNGKPTFQSKEAKQMVLFYEGMLEYYNLPLVLPPDERTFLEILFPPAEEE